MDIRSLLVDIFMRTRKDKDTMFDSVKVKCGSWVSAYQYVYDAYPVDGKDVTDFSTEMKSMKDVECDEDGKGTVVFTIKKDIVKIKKEKQDGKMEPRAEKDSKSTD